MKTDGPGPEWAPWCFVYFQCVEWVNVPICVHMRTIAYFTLWAKTPESLGILPQTAIRAEQAGRGQAGVRLGMGFRTPLPLSFIPYVFRDGISKQVSDTAKAPLPFPAAIG